MEQYFLSYKSSQISYYCSGAGPEVAVCFHGYGEDGQLYHFFEKYAGKQYSFFAIDFPFHGQTQWKEGLLFIQNDLSQIVNEILNQHKKEVQLLTLMGFSLGGRIALSYYEYHPQAVKKMVLFAPDGLKVNFWYWLSTQTWIGSKLFAYSMKKPGWFFSFLKMLNKLGLVNVSIFKFVNYYIGNGEARRLLYQRWVTLRKLKPDLRKIKQLIRLYKIPARLVYGKYDRIILPTRGEKFKKGIEEHCIVSVIDSGHQVVHENHISQLLPALLD